MNWKRCLAAVMTATGMASAQFPVQDMDNYSLGLGYTLAFRGTDITKANVPSHEVMHVIGFAYAPVPYLALQAGVGIDRLSVEPHNQISFHGDYGISPAFGISLYTPFFLSDMLRATAGAQTLYLDSEDDRGFRYSGFISNPFLGAILSPSTLVDVTLGARMHLINGTMQPPRGALEQPFSNQQTTRGYLSVTLKTPYEKAFMTLDLDVSPGVNSDWSNGPREATVGISFGAVLGWKSHSTAPAGEKTQYFPAYPDMKEKEKQMAEEIQ